MVPLLLTGCGRTYYSSFSHGGMIDTANYKTIQPKLQHSERFRHSGCPVLAIYEAFPEYDDIVNITISQKYHYVDLLGFRLNEGSQCEFSGTGVVYKDGIKASEGPITSGRVSSIKTTKKKKKAKAKPVEEEEEEASAPSDYDEE